MIERLPHRGAQTEYLTFHLTVKPHFDKRKLCNIFPNLREIIFKAYNSHSFQNHLSRPFQFVNSTSKFEKIVDYGECELTRQLVLSNLCNKLKTLELDVRYSADSVISDTITQLKNMPVLEHLGFRGHKVTLMDLERMHCNLPTIKSLHLGVHMLSGDIPRDVLASGLITKLHSTIYSVPDLLTHVQFYKYLYNNYPSANKPTYDDNVLLDADTDYVRDVYNEGIFPYTKELGLK
jgi:hypothetical protein